MFGSESHNFDENQPEYWHSIDTPAALPDSPTTDGDGTSVIVFAKRFVAMHRAVEALSTSVSPPVRCTLCRQVCLMSNREERLEAARRDIIRRAGGLISVGEAAAFLGVTASVVNERMRDGTLLFIPMPSGAGLPRAQFAPDGGTLRGLEKVLGAMNVTHPWMKVQLFLDDDIQGALEDGRIEDAVLAAESYLPNERGVEPKRP